ncbi:efflux RND transporter periplasmic adaptor subunit [Aliiroseovarius sp. 2305UL8-7]|uniref:efflux RND transporter periplasmic adaptor subunit n=1 Tax=Aliiroseovarius conchicola TaxID=3121637 RepID=UPI003528EB7A
MPRDELPDLNGKLNFESEQGAGRSKWLAVLFSVLLVGWMGSGFILPSKTDDAEAEDTAPRAVAVAVMTSNAQSVDLIMTAEGQSIPDRSTEITAEASGEVLSVLVARGDIVSAAQELGRLDAETFEAQLLQAKTQLDQASQDLEKATTLQRNGVATEDRVLQARSVKATAEAAVTAAQEQLDNTIIRAPFAGRLNDFTLDEGEYVNSGDVVAELLDNNPLTVVVQVPQQALSRLKKGQTAQVAFITGEERTGTIAFIGANANSQTRTFRVEITVENPDSDMPAGLSARIAIPTGTARGHFISPAILSLGQDGELGIKTVKEGDTAAFLPVSIVRAQPDGVWVTGLPDTAEIITVGQGFVNAGDKVDPRPEATSAGAEANQ